MPYSLQHFKGKEGIGLTPDGEPQTLSPGRHLIQEGPNSVPLEIHPDNSVTLFLGEAIKDELGSMGTRIVREWSGQMPWSGCGILELKAQPTDETEVLSVFDWTGIKDTHEWKGSVIIYQAPPPIDQEGR